LLVASYDLFYRSNQRERSPFGAMHVSEFGPKRQSARCMPCPELGQSRPAGRTPELLSLSQSRTAADESSNRVSRPSRSRAHQSLSAFIMPFRSAAIAARAWRAAFWLPTFSISSSAQVKYWLAASTSGLRRKVTSCRIGRNASATYGTG
jgi:hypothetical protein